MMEIERFEIAKLSLEKGDTLVVKTDRVITRDQAARVREMFADIEADGVKILVLSGGVTIEILKREVQS